MQAFCLNSQCQIPALLSRPTVTCKILFSVFVYKIYKVAYSDAFYMKCDLLYCIANLLENVPVKDI